MLLFLFFARMQESGFPANPMAKQEPELFRISPEIVMQIFTLDVER